MQRLIDAALGEVGYMEKASPKDLYSKTGNAGSNNYTKYAKEMSAYSPGIYANGYAWCDTFVDWCFVKAFGSEKAKLLIHGWSAYTPTSASYYKQHGQWHKTPQIGDQIFFVDSAGTICHTGIVYDLNDTYVYTVEGNTSYNAGVVANGGAVAKKTYQRNYSRIAGFGRPDYSIVKPEEQKEEITMYKTVDQCPDWAKKYVKKAVDEGYVKGNDKGNLELDDTKIWCLVVMMRITGVMA